MSTETHQPNSIVTLLQNLRDETTTLLRQEVKLATAELTEKFSEMGRNAVQVAIGGLVAYAGAILLLFGVGDLVGFALIRMNVDPDMAQWISRLAVGIIVAAIGGGMLMKAKKAISAENLVPEKTTESLKENKQWAQNKLQHSHESTI